MNDMIRFYFLSRDWPRREKATLVCFFGPALFLLIFVLTVDIAFFFGIVVWLAYYPIIICGLLFRARSDKSVGFTRWRRDTYSGSVIDDYVHSVTYSLAVQITVIGMAFAITGHGGVTVALWATAGSVWAMAARAERRWRASQNQYTPTIRC